MSVFRDRRGERIGPYRVEGPLGSGGMGEVIVAYDDRLDRRVAIKRVRHGASRDAASARARLRREARAAAGLNHPSIVQIHDILQEADGEAIVMELVAGRSVAQCLEDGPLSVEEALRLGRQVAEGLAVAHRAGLVHRDLKAENVMVTPAVGDQPGRAKILDFGLVKVMREVPADETLFLDEEDPSLTRRGAVIGTVRAMSPEQAAGAVLDRRSDLFSLGILLYEMLTGRSPFRGPTPAETVKRLLVDTPRPVRASRPDVPESVEALIERLLEKEPDRRPADADEVAGTLAGLEVGGTAAAPTDAPPTDERSLSDLPTGSYEGVPPIGRDETSSGKGGGASGPRANGRWRWRLTAAILVVLVALGWLGREATGIPVDPLRVLVERPVIVGESTAEIDLVASGVRIAALAVLADLEGVAPVEASLRDATPREPRAIALAEAADEVLVAAVDGQAGNARVSLRRVRGSDGEVLWVTTFDVASRAADLWVLAETVAVQLQRAYPGRAIRGVGKRDVGDEDYADFVRTIQRIDSGEVDWSPELARLETISARAPRFKAAHLRGVAVAWTLYSDTRDVAFLVRGETMLARARVLAPDDPWLLFWAFRLALDRGERSAAEQALATLVTVAPNDVGVGLCRASLAEHDGDLGAAVDAMTAVVERVPSWQNLYRLAELEQRRGDVGAARTHLEQLVTRLPANTWALAKLARLELVYGDLARAVDLYRRVIELKPHRSYFTNLGLGHFLLRRFDDAIDSYEQALALQPGHLITRFNLADAELARGDTATARARYRRIVAELESRTLDVAERMTMAQCLAQLGEAKRAVAVTLETLQGHPEDLEVVYQAALVYTLVGDVASALVNAEKALDGGYPPRWFAIPDFDPLRADPRFLARLGDPS